MSNIPPNQPFGRAPEQIGTVIGGIVVALVFAGVLWMMARATFG